VRSTRGGGNLPAGSFGWSGAYGTHFWIDPENDIAAIYMKNSYFDGGSGARTAWQFERDVMSALV
jgi:CubicO group peptidase (beta-lactamase class C family)